MKNLLLLLLLFPTMAQGQMVDQIKSIIQNDTIYESFAFAYEYEVVNGAIQHPDSLIAHLDQELLHNIPDQFPKQKLFYTDPWVCDQVKLPSGEIIDKHLVTYSPAHGEYVLCFFVIELHDELIEIDYTVRTGRYWWRRG